MKSLVKPSPSRLWLACALAILPHAGLAAQSRNAGRPVVTTGTVIEGDGTVIILSEPAERLDAARAALARKRPTQSAAALREAATFVRGQASIATGTVRADLQEAARDLDRIAGLVLDGKIKAVRALDAELRRSDRGLARHHFVRATRAWERRESVTAGHEIRRAAQYTERLARDAGHGVERGTLTVVRGTREVGAKLIDGIGWTSDEVGKAFNALGREIDRLGADVAPRRS
jgi:hypothetical protein